MDAKSLTLENKKAIAEYATQLGYYDHWYYREEKDVYGNNDETLEDTIAFIQNEHEIAENALSLLSELGLIERG